MEAEPEMAGRGAKSPPAKASATLVSNGAIDFRGRIADKATTGVWRAAPFIIVSEVAERMTFYAIAINLLIFLTKEMHEALPDASNHVTNWIGSAFVLTILGAFLADSYLGRFLTTVIFSSIYAVGAVLLTLAASIDTFRPPPCDFGGEDCKSATEQQNAFLFGAISLIAIGTGGIKPCISTFGADQFDQADPKEAIKKLSFFNWFFLAINFGAMLGITLVTYIEDRNDWGWGFGISAAANVVSVLTFVAGTRFYRRQKPRGSPLTRFLQVLVSAFRNYAMGVEVKNEKELFEVKTKESAIHYSGKLPHTKRYIFLDKAAVASGAANAAGSVNRWKLCTVTQVEEFKSFIRVLPIWATTIAFPFAFAQINFFINQGAVMDRRLSDHFVVPPGSVAIFATVNALFVIPLYERLAVPLLQHFTGHPRGLSALQRAGTGLFITIPTFAIAALVEHHRRSSADQSTTLTFWWLLPQYFLLGIAEVFTYVGQLEFFYDEATDGTRSLSSSMFLSAIGVGNWLSTLLVKIVDRATGGVGRGWLRSDLNRSKLDYYYWIVCGINAVNLCIFYMVVAKFYSRDGAGSRNNRDEVESNGSTEVGGGGEVELTKHSRFLSWSLD